MHLFIDVAGFRSGIVISVTAVERLPLVSPRHRSGSWQLVADGGRVTAVSMNIDCFGVKQRATEIEFERNRAGLVVAGRKDRRVHQRRVSRRKHHDCWIGDCGNCWGCRTDANLFVDVARFRNRIIVAVAAVGGIPLVSSCYGTVGRQPIAWRGV